MATPELDPPQGAPREHAAARYFRRTRRLFVALQVIGLGAFMSALVLRDAGLFAYVGPALFAVGLFYARKASRRERAAQGFVLAQHAHAALEDGRLDVASGLLSRFPKSSPVDLERAQALLLAKLALRRGRLDEAVANADHALEMKKGESETTYWLQYTCAHGLRALGHAASGRPLEAMADVEVVRSSGYGFGDAATYAMLAQGVLLERDGKRADLGVFLEQNRRRLRRGAGPGERALLRAWARMLVTLKRSVYRETAEKSEALEAAFVSAISPTAARFAEAPPMTDDTEDEAVAVSELEDVPRRRAFKIAAALASALVLTVGFMAAKFATGSAASDDVDVSRRAVNMLTVSAFVVIPLVIAVAWGLVSHQSGRRQQVAKVLYRAYAAYDAGDLAAGGALAGLVAKHPRMPFLTAPAELILSDIALDRGDAVRAEVHATRGLAALSSRRIRDFLSDTVVASLVANQAFAMAAQGRALDAELALARLPPNGFARRQRFPVELLIAWAKKDRAAMLRLVKRAPASLGPTAELITDLARAVLDPEGVGLAELLRVRVEVSREEERRLLLAYVPGLVSELEEVLEPSPEIARVRVLEEEKGERPAALDQAEREAEAAEQSAPLIRGVA